MPGYKGTTTEVVRAPTLTFLQIHSLADQRPGLLRVKGSAFNQMAFQALELHRWKAKYWR